MKKYRLKVDSPWGNKGDIYNESHVIIANVGGGPPTGIWQTVACNKLSDIFQEVIEQSDEEIVERWLIRNFHDISISTQQWKKVAKALIQHGFDVKKLRGES